MQEADKMAMLEAVSLSTTNGKVNWGKVASQIGTGLTKEQCRSKYRVLTGASNRCRKPEESALLSVLKNKRTPQQDADILHIPLEQFNTQVKGLLDHGYNISQANHLIWLERAPLASNSTITEPYGGETELIFGVISDTHFCNKKQQITYLNEFYDLCASLGIKTVYHAGDISDGYYKSRPDHIYELFAVGMDEQAQYIIQNYPRRPGIITKFITGNHDSTHVKNGGADIGRAISSERKDMKYLGYMSAKVWLTPQCDMDLFHPLDGAAYALSYPGQKYIDSLQGGSKPRILIVGHHHKAMYYQYRNIHTLEAACFEAQTVFEKGKRIFVNVGGWIVRMKCTPDGCITEFSPTLIPYYDMIADDWGQT